jgi:arylsulfatase A-like enzyme
MAAIATLLLQQQLLLASVTLAAAPAAKPKLVLQITVDQLRGDMLPRFASRFGPGGFRRLVEGGTYFADVRYEHLNTFTAVGHATLFTGGDCAEHGIAGNDWNDPETGQQVYCCEDGRSVVLGKSPKTHEGTGPRNLTSTTTGDELFLATAGQAKVFSVSIKDRGAILPGGHRGKAFWFDKETGRFVTSSYYFDAYPDWVTKWNESKRADQYAGKSWELLNDGKSYLFAGQDDRWFERPFKNMKRTFPHPLGEAGNADLYATLRFAPQGDELTADFVKALVQAEHLGADGVPDFLSLSLSATDYIRHAFGPDSLEAEDNLLHLDRTIAGLLSFLDEKVGRDAVLIVLSSDHGVDLVPEGRGLSPSASRRVPTLAEKALVNWSAQTALEGCDAGRHIPEQFIAKINDGLKAKFGVKQPLVNAFWPPCLFLDTKAVRELKLEQAAVERAMAEEILKLPGFARAFTRTDLLAGNVPKDAVAQSAIAAFHPKRSGHVMVVQSPYWYLYENPQEFAAMHGSPYACDTFVPLAFAGAGVPKGVTIHRRVSPRDVAPTIATCIQIDAPNGSTGSVLPEVFGEASPR